MQLPRWAIDLALPAQRFARRRQQACINERRRQHPLAQPARISENEAGQPAAHDESFQARAHKMRDHRLARISSIAAQQKELLYATSADLERIGTAEISTAEGNIAARLIRFRWGPDLLDVTRAHDGQPAGWSIGAVPRSPASARTAAITSAPAQALAALEPLALTWQRRRQPADPDVPLRRLTCRCL